MIGLNNSQRSWPQLCVKFNKFQGPHLQYSRRTVLIQSSIFISTSTQVQCTFDSFTRNVRHSNTNTDKCDNPVFTYDILLNQIPALSRIFFATDSRTFNDLVFCSDFLGLENLENQALLRMSKNINNVKKTERWKTETVFLANQSCLAKLNQTTTKYC